MEVRRGESYVIPTHRSWENPPELGLYLRRALPNLGRDRRGETRLIPTHRCWENPSTRTLPPTGPPHPDTPLLGESVCAGTPPPTGSPRLGGTSEGRTILSWSLGTDVIQSSFLTLLSSPLRSLPVSSHWPRLESREGLSRRAGDSAMIPTAYFWANRAGRVTRTDEPLTSQGRVLLGVPSSMVICLHSFNCSFSLRTSPPE